MDALYLYNDNEIFLHHSLQPCPDDRSFPVHFHDTCEIFCFVSGDIRYMVEGRVYRPTPGSLMIMRGAESHKLIVDSPRPYERYAIHFPAAAVVKLGFEGLLVPFFDRPLGSRNLYLPQEFSELRPFAFFAAMTDNSNANSGNSEKETIIANLLALLSGIRNAFSSKSNAVNVPDDIGTALIGYINMHLDENLSLDALSSIFHISTSQIGRIFKKAAGTGVCDYVISKRLITAQQLIADGCPAGEACRRSGFNDYSSFFRIYKKRFSASPTAAGQ